MSTSVPDSKALPKTKVASKTEPVDSWEDEEISSASSSDAETGKAHHPDLAAGEEKWSDPDPALYISSSPTQLLPFRQQSKASPTASITSQPDPYAFTTGPATTTDAPPTQRPEKSTAVASRLIAAGIGQKAPRRTKEEREYDAAMRAQERKKREDAKAAEKRKFAESERMKREVWGD